MFNFFVTQGMVIDKNHEINSFKQCRWLEKYTSFNKQKQNKGRNEFEKDIFALIKKGIFGKMLENLPKQLKVVLIKKL